MAITTKAARASSRALKPHFPYPLTWHLRTYGAFFDLAAP